MREVQKFSKLINQPITEKTKFLSEIGGFTKHVLDKIDTNLGYLNFQGEQYIEENDITGQVAHGIFILPAKDGTN